MSEIKKEMKGEWKLSWCFIPVLASKALFWTTRCPISENKARSKWTVIQDDVCFEPSGSQKRTQHRNRSRQRMSPITDQNRRSLAILKLRLITNSPTSVETVADVKWSHSNQQLEKQQTSRFETGREMWKPERPVNYVMSESQFEQGWINPWIPFEEFMKESSSFIRQLFLE